MPTGKGDGKARLMAAMAGNNLQIGANLLYELEDEFHPKPLALGSLKSSGEPWPVVQHRQRIGGEGDLFSPNGGVTVRSFDHDGLIGSVLE